MTVIRHDRHRVYPTPEQEQLLRQNLGCTRAVYNKCIDYAESRHENNLSYPGYYGPDGFAALITKLKHTGEYEWLQSADNTGLQNAAKQADFRN